MKEAICSQDGPDVDVVITELGGTVGDIEGLPFLEAFRQVPLDIGRENCLFIHLTLVPYLRAARELKTKPTQHSVGQLRGIGIQPDILVIRTERALGRDNAEKIALFCNVEKEAVIEEVDKTLTIYEVPLGLAENKIDQLIIKKLNLHTGSLEMDDWKELIHNIRNPEHEVTIAVVGKYIEHRDAYKSIYESLDHAGFASQTRIIIKRVSADDLESEEAELFLRGVDGILVPGGFGSRGFEGKIKAVQYARENQIPYFGICLGMQSAVAEFARNVLGYSDANSTEFEDTTDNPVICLLEEQKKITYKGGTMRLGTQDCKLSPGSRSLELYGKEIISERHRHRYEFNPDYREQFEQAGMQIAGTSPDGVLVEIVEIREHPWFVAVQFHPEFKSKPLAPHPLFKGFVAAALTRHQERISAPV